MPAVDDVLQGLAANPALPGELVDRLIGVADDDVVGVLAEREDLSRGQVVALAGRGEGAVLSLAWAGKLAVGDVDPVSQPLAAIAMLDQGVGDVEWARVLAGDPVVEHREKLASCPGLPDDVVERLAGDVDVSVVAELAWFASAEVAAGLARHPHAEVRIAVAGNSRTPPEVLAMLVTGVGLPPVRWCVVCERVEIPFVHPSDCMRSDCDLPSGAACDGSHQSSAHSILHRVAGNPSTPAGAVAGFADHPEMLIRWQVAERADLPQDVYARLAVDPYAGVRGAVAGNPAIGEAVARVLAGDEDVSVLRELAHNPAAPLDVLVSVAGVSKIGAVLLPRVAAASPAEVEELAASRSSSVRALVALRSDLPEAVRDTLVVDPDAKVVKAVARHPGLSEGQLRGMVERHGVRVAAQVAVNPDVPWGLLEELALQVRPVGKVLRAVAGRADAHGAALVACLGEVRARRVAAAHPALPVEVIVELLGHEEDDVVEAAASNPSLPVEVMLRLLA
ncbi:hypothetical protein [Streptomyces acidiscabies]|uniref:hypothetical protein n=1 Tax=Streptomyces acidiscabies TaxID=42234 RepID=UPI00076EE9B5|nr:leucine rich repeat variant [Streptomyces acidiscabies]